RPRTLLDDATPTLRDLVGRTESFEGICLSGVRGIPCPPIAKRSAIEHPSAQARKYVQAGKFKSLDEAMGFPYASPNGTAVQNRTELPCRNQKDPFKRQTAGIWFITGKG
ncbi:MAG: hypothetical protein AB1649_27800, partial [Chloroflexota bacterium]